MQGSKEKEQKGNIRVMQKAWLLKQSQTRETKNRKITTITKIKQIKKRSVISAKRKGIILKIVLRRKCLTSFKRNKTERPLFFQRMKKIQMVLMFYWLLINTLLVSRYVTLVVFSTCALIKTSFRLLKALILKKSCWGTIQPIKLLEQEPLA